MATVLLVIHLMIAVTLVAVVLLQRSEGGALGMGGGGGGGGFLSGRGTANMLTRVTAGLAAAFFTTSMLLTILAQQNTGPGLTGGATPADTGGKAGAPSAPAGAPKEGGILDALKKLEPVVPPSK